MTISTTTSRVSYNGNDVTVGFSFPYLFLANADLVVILYDSLGVGTTQVLDTDYTVTGAGDIAGGTVTMTTAPATGEQLVIYREMDLTQEVDYITGDAFPADTHERALDRLTMIAQQLNETLGRSIKVPVSSSLTSLEVEDLVADSAIIVNGTADGLIMGPTADEIANAQTYANNASTSASNAATSESNAATSETNAAASAAAAAAAVSSVAWRDVSYKTFSDTPIAITSTDNGVLFNVDCTSGNVVINLPSIAGLTLTNPFAVGVVKTDSSANTVTINRNGADVINGAASFVLDLQAQGVTLTPDADPANDEWNALEWGTTFTETEAHTWTASQRATITTDNDGSFDMSVTNNFKWTPTGADTLEFTNETEGQSGLILLVNGSDYAISLGAEIDAAAGTADLLSATGTYLIQYWCYDGTNVGISHKKII